MADAPTLNSRRLTQQDFYDQRLASATPETLTTRTLQLLSIVISNVTASDRLLTLTDGNGVTRLTFQIAARDLQERTFPDGWQFASGLVMSCDAGSAVDVQLYGKQKNN